MEVWKKCKIQKNNNKEGRIQMTLEEFRNLKIGDEIVFKDDVYVLHAIKNDIYTSMRYVRKNDNCELDFVLSTVPNLVSLKFKYCTLALIHFDNLNISLNKSEKEKIQDQIKILQDKLKELEKNDVENVIKTLIPGDFIEVYYKDPSETNPYIYEVRCIDNPRIGIYSYNIDQTWSIISDRISKIIVRKDIKEAHEKFLSLVRSNP